jgi:hypothetical protein
MILPSNGKIVIIDDVFEDVKPLMKALSQEGMPFLFFKDQGGDDLPVNGPIEDIRLVFLDLDLGIGGLSPKENIRYVQERLYKIIKPNTPYVLVIWSTHDEGVYKQTLLEDFETHFSDYKPIAYCSLEKATLLSLEASEVVSTIRIKLKESLKKFEAFNAFLLWESIVSKSSGEIVNGFTNIFEIDDSWDNNLKAFFYRLAKANVGLEKVKLIDDSEKLKIALETITSALSDSIEKNIVSEIHKLPLEIKEVNSNITNDHLIFINTKLHFINSELFAHFHPGNLYIREFNDDKMIEGIVTVSFNKNIVEEVLKSKIHTIQVDVTPICDYSQDKKYTRVLSGVLIHQKYWENKKSSTKIFIYDLCPIVNIMGDNYFPIFDFRFFKSLKQEIVQEVFPSPNYRIRSQLLIDLQAGLSNHINRPGIVSVI